MDLRIGQTVQLITHGPHPRKYFTPLIGFVEREFIMLRTPLENGWAVQFSEGESLDVRVFSGVSLYDFQVEFKTQLLNPRHYLLLTCPSAIRHMRLRSHERVKCDLPVSVHEAPAGSSPWSGFHFHDLSGGGAALVGPHPLGEAGQRLRLQLDFHLTATDTQEQLMLEADIQSVQPLQNPSDSAAVYQHGIRFGQIEPKILLLVSELQNSKHAEHRSSEPRSEQLGR